MRGASSGRSGRLKTNKSIGDYGGGRAGGVRARPDSVSQVPAHRDHNAQTGTPGKLHASAMIEA